ncbi:hypothetical protein GF362_02385 [Candidatus Dojkabacteria bacterium]|nr:hypothetical protein [Candidatus Dojkabacteria bacterium]
MEQERLPWKEMGLILFLSSLLGACASANPEDSTDGTQDPVNGSSAPGDVIFETEGVTCYEGKIATDPIRDANIGPIDLRDNVALCITNDPNITLGHFSEEGVPLQEMWDPYNSEDNTFNPQAQSYADFLQSELDAGNYIRFVNCGSSEKCNPGIIESEP